MANKLLSITSKQLVEYMNSSAVNRSKILDNILEDNFALYLLWYEEYKSAFSNYMVTQDFYRSFNALKESLMRRDLLSCNSQQENKIIKQLDAIDLTSDIAVFNKIPNSKCYNLPSNKRKMEIAGLIVKLGEVSIVQNTVNNPYSVGLISPYLKSTTSLTPKVADIHGVILHWFAETQLSRYGKASNKLCITVDVFASKIALAPVHYKRVRKNIKANCHEIRERLELRLTQNNKKTPKTKLEKEYF